MRDNYNKRMAEWDLRQAKLLLFALGLLLGGAALGAIAADQIKTRAQPSENSND